MSYKVSISECGRWVQTKVRSHITMELALEFIAAAAQVAEEYDIQSFLFDLRDSSNVKSPTDDYKIANHHLRDLGFRFSARVALLVTPDDKTHDFLQVTAANAGHNWQLFDNEQAATEWLQEGCDQDLPQRRFGSWRNLGATTW